MLVSHLLAKAQLEEDYYSHSRFFQKEEDRLITLSHWPKWCSSLNAEGSRPFNPGQTRVTALEGFGSCFISGMPFAFMPHTHQQLNHSGTSSETECSSWRLNQHCSSRGLITLKLKGKKKRFRKTVHNTHSGANLGSFCSSATDMTTTNDRTCQVLNTRKMKIQLNSQKEQEHSNCFTTEQDFSSCSPVSETGH